MVKMVVAKVTKVDNNDEWVIKMSKDELYLERALSPRTLSPRT